MTRRTWSVRLSAAAAVATVALVLGMAACAADNENPRTALPAAVDAALEDRPVTRRDADPSAYCDGGPVQLGERVEELALEGDPPPPLGGPIEEGTYVLTEANAYVPFDPADASEGNPGLTGQSARATLLVVGDVGHFLRARGPADRELPADERSTVLLVTAGTNVQTTEACPVPLTKKTYAYSAVGPAIALFTDAKHRELYTKK